MEAIAMKFLFWKAMCLISILLSPFNLDKSQHSFIQCTEWKSIPGQKMCDIMKALLDISVELDCASTQPYI